MGITLTYLTQMLILTTILQVYIERRIGVCGQHRIAAGTPRVVLKNADDADNG